MTKKDYELIASAFDIAKTNDYAKHATNSRTDHYKALSMSLNTAIQTARRMAMKLEKENPKFDRVRFLRDCGMTDNQLMEYNEIEKDWETYKIFSLV